MKSKVYNNPKSRANEHRREYPIKLDGYSQKELDEFLQGWTIEEVDPGNWRGTHRSGTRTALKGLRSDVVVAIICDEILCPRWPDCEHQTPQQCARERARATMPKWRRAA